MEKNVVEWACEFKKYSQYEQARQEYDNGNKRWEDVLFFVGLIHPSWIKKYNNKERV